MKFFLENFSIRKLQFEAIKLGIQNVLPSYDQARHMQHVVATKTLSFQMENLIKKINFDPC
jgi:hypothetical protein